MGTRNANTNNGSKPISFCGVLTIVFIVLKLTNHIDWSWWWVTAPLWLPFAFAVVVYLICTLIQNRKRIVCAFKGHNYESKCEHRKMYGGESWRWVTRCTRCGGIKP